MCALATSRRVHGATKLLRALILAPLLQIGSMAANLGHTCSKIVELNVNVPAAVVNLLFAVEQGKLTRAVP